MFDWGVIQKRLAAEGLDGWLLYDFRGSNYVLYRLLKLSKKDAPTRRLALWIPQEGQPALVIHAIEAGSFPDVAIEKRTYVSQREWIDCLSKLVKGKIAMEVVPNGEIPSLSLVDGGTLQAVLGLGVEVVSSGDLLTQASMLNSQEIASLREACVFLNALVEGFWKEIPKRKWTEAEAAGWLEQEMKKNGFVTESSPHVAVNAHAADPHYHSGTTPLEKGDLVLVDLWCKKGELGIYSDLTRMGVIERQPTTEEETLFNILLQAQKAGVALLNKRLQNGERVEGQEIDRAVRDVVTKAGFGPFFIHRTGHNITSSVHGMGTHLDSFETNDTRPLLPNTCCSLEPGIYLPGRLGLRLETDLLLHPHEVEVVGGWQEAIVQI